VDWDDLALLGEKVRVPPVRHRPVEQVCIPRYIVIPTYEES
jgi:hypothetical protein